MSRNFSPAGPRRSSWCCPKTGDAESPVAFVVDGPHFTLHIGKGNARGLRLGYSTPFAVEARKRRLVVRLDGRQWEFEVPRALADQVVWGVGAQQGSAGIWEGVTVTAAGR